VVGDSKITVPSSVGSGVEVYLGQGYTFNVNNVFYQLQSPFCWSRRRTTILLTLNYLDPVLLCISHPYTGLAIAFGIHPVVPGLFSPANPL
jgi:hypothetical protein